MKHTTKDSFVYVVQAGDTNHVKIGVTTNLKSRVATIQTSNPHKCHVIALWPGDRTLEQQIHSLLATYRVEGEWFRLSVADLRLFRSGQVPKSTRFDLKAYLPCLVRGYWWEVIEGPIKTQIKLRWRESGVLQCRSYQSLTLPEVETMRLEDEEGRTRMLSDWVGILLARCEKRSLAGKTE